MFLHDIYIVDTSRCNQRKDCADNTDEMHCELIQFPSSYLKSQAPNQQNSEVINNVCYLF